MLVPRQERRVRTPASRPRSGVLLGFRLASLLLLQIPEVRQALKLSHPEVSCDPVSLSTHLSLEQSYVRRVMRLLRDEGVAQVVEIPQRGTPPIHVYSIAVEPAAARVRVA